MNVLINFANKNYRSKQKVNSTTGKYIGGFDKVYEFSPDDIDSEFIKEHQDILDQKRGFGYWLWKPYFILKVLEQQNEGDYIFYCDSGAFFINRVDHLISIMNKDKIDIMLFEIPLIEYEWTNQYLFDALDLNTDKFRLSNQICSGYILLKSSNENKNFIREYLSLCSKESYITDMHRVGNIVKDHRHDQSILSLLAKSKGIIPYKDPSDYGVFPFRYFSTDRLFRLKRYDDNFPVIVLSNRKVNPFIYWFKFIVRCLLKKLSRIN